MQIPINNKILNKNTISVVSDREDIYIYIYILNEVYGKASAAWEPSYIVWKNCDVNVHI